MLNAIFSNPRFIRFYEADLPRVCFWVGLLSVVVYFGLFLFPIFSGTGPQFSLLTPFKSDFLAGIVLVVISFALSRESPAIPTLFMLLGLLVAAQYVRVSSAVSGITGPIPLSYLGNLTVTLELLVILVLYIYSVKRLRDGS